MKKSVYFAISVLLLILTLSVPAGKSHALSSNNSIPPGDEFIRFEYMMQK